MLSNQIEYGFNNSDNNFDCEDSAFIDKAEIYLRQILEYDEFKRTIESILFQARRPVKIREFLKILTKTSKERIINAIHDIQKEYKLFDTVLKIIEYADQRFELIVKKEIINAVEKFTLGDLFNQFEIKILAYVIFKHPNVSKREISSKFGSSAYNYIKTLKKKGFIEENNKKVFLTTHFFDYFELKDNSQINLKEFL